MNTHTQYLLSLLKRDDPVIVSHHWRKRLEVAKLASLWQPYTPVELMPCPYCHHAHRVQVQDSGQRYFFTCGTTQVTQHIPAHTLRRWRLHLPSLLTHIAEQLGIQPGIDQLYSSIIWRLGTIRLAGTKNVVECWLCRRVSPSALVWLLNQDVHDHTVLLTLGATPLLQQLRLPLTCLDISRLLRGPVGLQLDRHRFQHWIAHTFQRVLFDPMNGDLWVDGKRACTAMPASAQFFFIRCLWEQFNCPISHEEIFTYCCRQLAKRDGITEWQSEYLPASFCHTMKRLLKKQAYDKDLCDEIVQATRTHDEQNAYRLTTPSYSSIRS